MNKISKIKTIIMGLILIILAFIVISSTIKEFKFNDQESKDAIYEQIKEYLIDNNQVSEEGAENSHTFVEIEKLGIKGSYKKSFVYVYALIKEYYIKDDKLVEAISTNMPYAFVYKRGKIIKQKTTKSFNEWDLREIFPSSIYNQIIYINRLSETNINQKIEEYYKDFLDKKEYDDLIGEWNIKRATLKGKDFSLTELFGTGIQYGGKITLSKIGKYTEFIGVYSHENIDDYQGIYEIKGPQILLSSNSGKTKTLNYNKKTEELSEQVDKDTIIYFTKNKTQSSADKDYYINYSESATN